VTEVIHKLSVVADDDDDMLDDELLDHDNDHDLFGVRNPY